MNLSVHKITFFASLILWCIFGKAQSHPTLDSIVSTFSDKGINLLVSDYHCDEEVQLCHYYLQQVHHNLPLYGFIGTFTVSQSSSNWHYAPNTTEYKVRSNKSSSIQISDFDVINSILQEFQIEQISLDLVKMKSSSAQRRYAAPRISQEDITISEVYLVQNGTLSKIIKADIYLNEIQEWWEVLLESTSGEIVKKVPWTLYCSFEETCISNDSEDHNHVHSFINTPDSSYNVFGLPLNSPDEGNRTTVSTPWTAASPLTWHDIDGIIGVDSTNTSGNNVYAYPDRDANGVADGIGVPEGGLELIFDNPLDLNQSPASYIEAATTNLFYWNNVIHDIMYNYGFTEEAGNFQNYNYTGLGSAGDYVRAEAQDGSGSNNANFFTPPDGFRPRMQMFEWSGSQSIGVNINGQSYDATGARFGAQTASINAVITQPTHTLGCNAINSMAGAIGLIDRGDCKFVRKAMSVQNAGGVAMIICNYENSLLNMGGDTSAIITIPSIMLTQSDCDEIKIQLDQGPISGSINITGAVDRDSDFDNGIIIHEYGHGISNRLTGGRLQSSCLSNREQMGEGWSDYYGLLLTMKSSDSATEPRGMATYVSFEPVNGNGIRNYPYTTDMQTNPFTYEDVDEVSVPHGVGSIWATILWDMTWFLVNKHEFGEDIYNGTNGNHISLRLVTEALKLQPCGPGFVDGRDAILAADELLYGGTNKCIIWEAFARRGVGYGADQGSSDVLGDEIVSFEMPPSCSDVLSLELKSSETFTYIGDTLELTYSVINKYPTTIDNLILRDTIVKTLTAIPESLSQGTLMDSIFEFTQTFSDSGDAYIITMDVELTPFTDIYLEHKESFEGSSSWAFVPETGTIGWEIASDEQVWGNESVFIENSSSLQTHYLERTLYLTEIPIFSFWHTYSIEAGWDGGFIQLSNDGGQNWDNLEDNFISHGYDRRLANFDNPVIGNQMAFTGESNGFIQSIIDLSEYSNQFVIMRFVFGSDSSVSRTGWYIDAIALYNGYIIDLDATIRADNHHSTNSSEQILILSDCPSCEPDYNCPGNLMNLSTIDQTYYRAENQIMSSAVISNGSKVRLRAGNSIQLSYPFETGSNTELILQLDDCED